MPATLEFQSSMILVFVMVLLYIFFGKLKAKHGIALGHEASFICLLCLAISFFYFQTNNASMQGVVEFNDNLFFYFCLPPLVFASGFNMQRKKFFENISNILLFGVGGTIVTFMCFYSLTSGLQALINNGTLDITSHNWNDGSSEPVNLSQQEIMLMCSLLCSTDVIAAISMVNYSEQPKLYSLLFGEGVVNDAVSIIIFNSVTKFEGERMNAGTGFKIIGDFFLLALFSLSIGILFGAFSAMILKYTRMLTKDAVAECIFLFSFGYLCYVSAETLKQSGIIALLTCGIMMAHYSWYNLSPQGRQGSALVFQFLGNGVQGFIFAYLGLTFFAYQDFSWSLSLASYMLPIIVIGRFTGTLLLVKLLDCCGYNSGVKTGEVFFIGFAGLIRGAIAFGLVLRLNQSLPNRGLIVTTALTIVVFTTIFFGFFVGVISKWVTQDEPKAETTIQDDNFLNINTAEQQQQVQDDNDSAYQPLEHPNMQMSERSPAALIVDEQNSSTVSELGKHPKVPQGLGCLARCLYIADYHILKPLLVHKYSVEKVARDNKFFEDFESHADELRDKVYSNRGDDERKQTLSAHNLTINDDDRFVMQQPVRETTSDKRQRSSRKNQLEIGNLGIQAEQTSEEKKDVRRTVQINIEKDSSQ